MAAASKEVDRRERLREYDAALAAARSPVGVLVQFAKGREARGRGEALEEEFATTAVEGVDADHRLPAAVWVALRQGDVAATIEALVRTSGNDMVIAAHGELDAGYRLITVEERRPLPDVEPLQAQVAALLQVPRDVVAIIAGWGPDDPRTAAEIESLLDQRFGPVASARFTPSPEPGSASVNGPAATDRSPAAPKPSGQPMPSGQPIPPTAAKPGQPTPAPTAVHPAAAPRGRRRPGLVMSRAEFVALLALTPEQRDVLGMLVRQADITIVSGP